MILLLLSRKISYFKKQMKNYRLLIPVALIQLLTGVAGAQTAGQNQKDSLQQVIAHAGGKEKLDAYLILTNLYMAEARDKLKIDTLFSLYDAMDAEAEKQGNDSLRCVILKNRLYSLYNAQRYDEVIRLTPGYMAFTENRQQWNIYYQLFEPLVRAYSFTGDTDRAFALVEKMLDEAKTRNHPSGIGLANYTWSGLYQNQRRFMEQEEHLREAIRQIQDDPELCQNLTQMYRSLGASLIAQNRFDEAEVPIREMEQAVRRLETLTGSPHPNEWLVLFGVYRDLYQQSGQFDKAELYCDKLDSLSGGTVNSFETRSFIYMHRKQYDRALEMAGKAIETAANPSNRLAKMGARMIILLQMYEPEKSERQFRDIILLQDSIYRGKLNAQLDELRTQYEVERITAEKELIAAEKERMHQFLLFTFGGCILLAVILCIYIYYNRLINIKNRALFRRIKEQDALVETLGQIAQKYEALEKSTVSDAGSEIIGSMAKEIPGDRQQRNLVSRLHEYLTCDRRFTQVEITMDEVITALATNRSDFFEAVRAVTDKTPADYINNLRLEEAKRMLENNTGLNVELIAENCGFSTRMTFYRLFSDRYQITPAKYRRLAQES
jgi:AraC-like DNA-binding protein